MLIIGDSNTKAGNKAESNAARKFGLGDRHEAAECFIEFCDTKNQTAAHVYIARWSTQKSNRLSNWNQEMEKLYSTKTSPGVNCGTDHELLISNVRVKLKKLK